MSATSWFLLLLAMWAVVAVIYTTLFTVGGHPDDKEEKASRPVSREPVRPAEHHEMPHAA